MNEAIVSVRNVGKRFGAKQALAGVTVEVARGDVIGLLGKNGAGKTTLLDVMLGFSPASEGSVEVFGESCLTMSQAAKGRIGFVPQQDELLGTLSGQQQLAITAAFHSRWDHALIERLIAEWEVPTRTRILSMSVGERQKLSVLTAFGHHPELLVLDEPVASLDPLARRAFLKHLLDVAEIEGRAVVFSSHIVSDLERAANKVWILKAGRLHWQGPLDTLKESVVRLHVRSRKELPAALDVPNALTCRVEGNTATVAVSEWSTAAHPALAARLEASVEVEPLSLEEIFVELNR